MEERKLTKADIDKVRHIEGFPIAKDEDIIALSRPPYYTACPNPFIEDFIRENGTPYDETTDDYHREPFAADVSEGKNDPIYNAHSYHTKVPHKAIMRYILHYTKPGDIVFDGFCGTGMTGVAAQMCGCPDPAFKAQIESEMSSVEWGPRKVILNDLSPAATFIAHNYNTPINVAEFEREARRILAECESECGWMYETQHVDRNGKPVLGIDGKPIIGRIQYVVWSDVFICPSCSKEVVFWDAAVDQETGSISDEFVCPHCGAKLTKRDCERAWDTKYDRYIGATQRLAKQIPVHINYTTGSIRHTKSPDAFDFEVLKRIQSLENRHTVPNSKNPDGEKMRDPARLGINYSHQFYTDRNLIVLSMLWDKSKESRFSDALLFVMTGIVQISSKLSRFRYDSRNPKNTAGGIMNGTLFVPSLSREGTVFENYERRLASILQLYKGISKFNHGDVLITCGAQQAIEIEDNSIDYIFTDPPFGANINYSELSNLWEAWLKIQTDQTSEAIISGSQKKGLPEYQSMMEACFKQYYRILKPSHWITIEFHNSKNAVWNAIQEGLSRAGFIVADVRVIDKKQGSFNQVSSQGAVQQDLIITAYKPKESFVREFQQRAGDPEMAWEFVRQHLRNVPITADGNHDGKLDIIAERQDYLLFDRMVAWHIMNGIPVPLDAHAFYEGLRKRFIERDSMFFLSDQVNEYDDKRAFMELDNQQLSFAVTDEKNAIGWLNYVLGNKPLTYQELQPLYMQVLHQSRQEKMPELLDMLKENFIQDEKGAWYVPDLTNAADLAKVRRKALLKEFYDSCVPGKGKLKVFRMEAIRAGFDECWKLRDFKTIVTVGERLPEAVLQEDPALLMYYDNACSRV